MAWTFMGLDAAHRPHRRDLPVGVPFGGSLTMEPAKGGAVR
jgi:hypothetical protein